MAGGRYQTFSDFRQEILRHRSGPLVSPVEEVADEMYHQAHADEFDDLWDTPDGEDD